MTKNKFLFSIAFLSVFLIVLINISSAETIIGTSPANINFKNVLRGGYAERYFVITTNSEKPVNTSVEIIGAIKDWLNVSSFNQTISINKPFQILVSVKPPQDVPNGNYTGMIRVKTETTSAGQIERHSMGNIIPVIDLVINTEVTDTELFECNARDYIIESAEKGDDLLLTLNYANNGNIRLKPKVTLDIWDQEQISIIKSLNLTGNEILPTKDEKITFRISTKDLENGQYWVDVSAPDCYSSETLTFDVLEPGTLKAEGILLNILGKTWVEVGETVPITANFKNTGEKEVTAQFKGQVASNGKIIQILESEKSLIKKTELSNFTFFFTPNQEGKYIVGGRVFYDKKRTFESSTVINAIAKKFDFKKLAVIAAYALAIFIVAVLIYKIRKEKKRYG